jgi:GntR family transcriptional regulator
MLDTIQLHTNGIPLYVQLREQFLAAIGSGELQPGEQMPTMRQLAVTLRINLSTVQQAYADLEREGFIVTRRGRGTFVSDAPPASDPDKADRRIEAIARQVMAMAASQGVDPAFVARRILEISGDDERWPSS